MNSISRVQPPGPPDRFAMRRLRHDALGFLLNTQRTYGDIARLRMGFDWLNAYLVSDPDAVRTILVEDAGKFEKGRMFKRSTHIIIGKGLLTSEGELHKRQRRLVQPAFHHNRIAAYAETMVQQTQTLLEDWQDGQTRDIRQDMMGLTLAIVADTLFGADLSADTERIGRAVDIGLEFAIEQVTAPPLRVPYWLIPSRKNFQRLDALLFMRRTLKRIIDDRRASGEDRGDLLSMLLLAQDDAPQSGVSGGMSDKQIYDEVITLFIAGHETTANALAWSLMLLAEHPDAAATLRAELDTVLAGRTPTMNDLPTLPYTEMVIKEAMRLYPPGWVLSRTAVDDIDICGYTLAKGSFIVISPYVMHRNPRYFPEPERFAPQRFSEESEKSIPKYAYLPFGGGPRYCIGASFAMMEAKLVLATIAQRYNLSLLAGHHVELEPLITLRPKGGLPMTCTVREPARA